MRREEEEESDQKEKEIYGTRSLSTSAEPQVGGREGWRRRKRWEGEQGGGGRRRRRRQGSTKTAFADLSLWERLGGPLGFIFGAFGALFGVALSGGALLGQCWRTSIKKRGSSIPVPPVKDPERSSHGAFL